jgi:hypothetical protein
MNDGDCGIDAVLGTVLHLRQISQVRLPGLIHTRIEIRRYMVADLKAETLVKRA